MPNVDGVSSLDHIMTLEQVQSAKYLGINLDRGQRISEISSKATKTWIFGVICLLHLKLRNLSPNAIECAAPIWHLYLKTQT